MPGSGALPRTWQAWAACGSEPLAAGPPALGSFRNPRDPHWALHSTFLLPARGARPGQHHLSWVWASWTAPMLAE